MRSTLLSVVILAFAAPAAAEIYQWRDAQGQVHYSDTPPPGHEVAPARRPAPPALPTRNAKPESNPVRAGSVDDAAKAGGDSGKTRAQAPAAKGYADKETEFRKRRAEAAEASAKAEEERARSADRKRNCEQARNQLTALESGQRMARFNSRGEREVIDDAMRADETARTKKSIATNCD